MSNVTIQKRGKYYQYKFEIASVDGKRKFLNKSGFRTKSEAEKEGILAYNEYLNTGRSTKSNEMSYSDFLDYWLDNHCKINLKYHTIEAYSNIVKNHLKPNLGFYRLSQITKTTLQDFLNKVYVEKGYSKNFLNNIRKVLKCSFNYATENEYIKFNSAANLKLPKYDVPPDDPAHIFTNEEINMILDRFKNNHCIYYAFLTAYCTGLRIAEVFALTWDDIDFKNKTISINKNILKKNQAGGTKGRHISGNSTTVWYFGTCKTQTSYRTIPIGETLLNALKEYKKEQEENKKNYGDTYMKHYKKSVINPYNNKQEIKILNAYAELQIPLVLIFANLILISSAIFLHKQSGISLKKEIFVKSSLSKDIFLGIILAVISFVISLFSLIIMRGRTDLAFGGWDRLTMSEIVLMIISLVFVSGICKEIFF